MSKPEFKYTKSHEWVDFNAQTGIARIGISDFAIAELTDLVHIELPEIGTAYKAGEIFGEVESVKAVSDLYTPVSGEIVAANTSLVDDLAVLSEDAYEQGWMIELKLENPSELEALMTVADYEKHCADSAH